ncbi:MAG: insulinase family protein [Clostridia bacterium]|nr:insulinase family protein [Clostridia bacterium]
MQIIENDKIKEKLYIEKLSNGLTIMVLPKKTRKKYIVWSANFGSIDNKFYAPGEKILTVVPDGIAHYLEHKLFEQENGKNSLDVLCSLGVDANAYTTNDHTAYLYECTENFDEALEEFMNYVQNPYFTDENVEKERGIIEQEIMMYDDYPDWALYMNAMKSMYKDNEINIDVAGTKETIAKINKEKLYKIYNSFYTPENMLMVLSGDFVPEEIIEKLKTMITMKSNSDETKRVYNKEQEEIVQKYVEKEMNISIPTVLIAYKDNDLTSDKIKKDIAIDILGTIIFGKSSKLFEKLYEEGKIFSEPSVNYEFSKTFAHILIQLQTNYVEEVLEETKKYLDNLKRNGILEEDFERAKRRVYGDLVKDYNDVADIATGFVNDYFKGINSFDYFEEFNIINKEYVEKVLKELFVESKKVISVVKPIEK